MYFFFFSSRRRHTRCSRDWSSDVCSSDLGSLKLRGTARIEDNAKIKKTQIIIDEIPFQVNKAKLVERIAELVRDKRSEERRVGKECRSRWARYHKKKKKRITV